ncbi:MAG: hypothetical protein WBA67_02225 [Jannaschia sp.]
MNSAIDWAGIDSLETLETCIFEAADVFADRGTTTAWLAANGFQTLPPQDVPASSMRFLTETGAAGWLVSGTMSRDSIPFRLGFLDRFVVHSLSVGITLDETEKPVRVAATFTRT